MATALSVNLNKIALLRNSRPGDYPSVLGFGSQCLEAGANGLTVHPRPDQRHIRPDDVRALAALCSRNPTVEFNVEGNPFSNTYGNYPGLMHLIQEIRPTQVTFVPDGQNQLTSDHGFDLHNDAERLNPIIEECHQLGVRVSLFMDPDIEQISLAKQINADRIELYTGPYAQSYTGDSNNLALSFQRYKEAAEHANAIGLEVNAGHDLNLENLGQFLTIKNIKEVSIGHALTVDALNYGFVEAVKRYHQICTESD